MELGSTRAIMNIQIRAVGLVLLIDPYLITCYLLGQFFCFSLLFFLPGHIENCFLVHSKHYVMSIFIRTCPYIVIFCASSTLSQCIQLSSISVDLSTCSVKKNLTHKILFNLHILESHWDAERII